MRVRDVLRQKGSDVVTIEPDRTLHVAICRLNEYKIGALIVTGGGGEVAGIITERDILRMCGERCVRLDEPDLDLTGCPALVGDNMSRELVIGLPDDELDYVMGVMTQNRVRHLPIMDDGELVGIISIGDVVRAHRQEAEYENRMLKDYIHGVATR